MLKFSFHLSRRWTWILGSIAAVVLIVVALSYLIKSEFFRQYIERKVNRHLKGYAVHIGGAYFRPLAFSLGLEDLTLTQDANPSPPVAFIKRLQASVHWREILTAHLVGDFLIDHPKVHINLKNIHKEEESKVPFKKKGWQKALESIYPLKINVLTITEGDFTYTDEGPFRPLHVSKINFKANNIRNIHSPEYVYPSLVHLEGLVFDMGKIKIDGYANFLEEPHIGFKVGFSLANMDLSYFRPILERYHLSVTRGALSAAGDLEYAPRTQMVRFQSLTLKEAKMDYLHQASSAPVEKRQVKEAVRTAAETMSATTPTEIRIDNLKIQEGELGYVNRSASSPYRIFFNYLDVTMHNFSNRFVAGPATLILTGKFMGSGNTRASGTFRPEAHGPNFDIKIAIDNTDLRTMNDLLRAYGKFDVSSGLFSFYSELSIQERTVQGYVKPLFKDIKVGKHGEKKSIPRRIYEGVVGGLVKLLENPRETVATKTPISGPVESPKADTWEIVVRLLQNSFFKSILPEFESQIR
jgi:hypothetical protein